jgi:hypothetical protein
MASFLLTVKMDASTITKVIEIPDEELDSCAPYQRDTLIQGYAYKAIQLSWAELPPNEDGIVNGKSPTRQTSGVRKQLSSEG